MKIENRMGEVNGLRNKVCQDFLKLVIKPNWQQNLYTKAKFEVENNTGYKVSFSGAYNYMRDNGVIKYTIDKMDITLISAIFTSCPYIAAATKETKNAIRNIRSDRNTSYGHLIGNEEDVQLYLFALLSLCDLRNFVYIVDKEEQSIAEQQRLTFRQNSVQAIDQMQELLDEERIELVQKYKEYDKRINKVLASNDRDREWNKVFCRYTNDDNDSKLSIDEMYKFHVRAYDAGITQAAFLAIHSFIKNKEYAEAEKRIWRLYNSININDKESTRDIVSFLNHLIKDNALSSDMRHLADEMIKTGYSIRIRDDGLYDYIYPEQDDIL